MDVPFDKILPQSEFPGFKQSKKYVDYTDTDIIADLPEFQYWSNCVDIQNSIYDKEQNLKIKGQVVNGFKRGSK